MKRLSALVLLFVACGTDGDAASWVAEGDVSTPDKAWDVGAVVDNPDYIGNVIDDNANDAFFLFEVDNSFEIRLHVQNSTNPFDFIHLHAADGNGLGEELEPNNYEVQSNGLTGFWDVEAGKSYYFEVHVPGGGFF